MNTKILKGKANEIIGAAKQKFALMGDNDYALLAEGKVQEFSGIAQKATGKTEDEIKKGLREIEKSCDCSFYDDKAA